MKGLTCDFTLEKGKFHMFSGSEKTRSSIWFLINFDKIYPYDTSFSASLLSLLQKPVSYMLTNRTLILNNIQRKVEKYVPSVKVNRIDIGYSNNDRTKYVVQVGYTSKGEDNTTIQDVTFV